MSTAKIHEINVDIPDINCPRTARCGIQVVQIMTGTIVTPKQLKKKKNRKF